MSARGRGRRPGGEDTRGQILEAAREAFARDGYRATTIRAVAQGAGVDPALVHHYFGRKDDLFLAVVRPPIDPRGAVARVTAGDRATAGERVVRLFLEVWDGPGRNASETLLRSAAGDADHAALLRTFLETQLIEPVLAGLEVPRPEWSRRGALLAVQLMGMAMARRIVGFDWAARASADEIVTVMAPNIQRLLTGTL